MRIRTLVLVLVTTAFTVETGFAASPRLHFWKDKNTLQAGDVRDVRLPDSKKQVSKLAKKLKMSSRQTRYMRAILADRDYQLSMIQASDLLSQGAKNDRIGTVLVGSNDQIESVLSQKQKRRFEDVLVREHQREQKNRERAALGSPAPVGSDRGA